MIFTIDRSSGMLRPAFLLIHLFLLSAGILTAQSGAGIDCECDAAGSFIGPDEGETVEISQDSVSPGGKYYVTVTGTGPFDVTVRRTSDDVQVYAVNLSNGYWGFSPDDDRFLYHYITGSVHNAVLIDLGVFPAQQRWTGAESATEITIAFSPFGDYLLYATSASPGLTLLSIIETQTGALVYEEPFSFYTAFGAADELGMVGWGFSPDSVSRTFVYAYPMSMTAVQWIVVNLQEGDAVHDATLTGISSFWQFSPCGDVLGIAEQTSPSFIDVRLYKTNFTQPPLYAQTLGFATVEFRTTPASHIVTVGTTDYTMNANDAEDVCTIAPASVTIDPDTVVGGNSATGTIVLNNLAGPGGFVVDLSSSDTSAATVPPTVTVPADSAGTTFIVQTFSVSSVALPVISAGAAGVTVRDTVTVLPASVASVGLAQGTVLGGDSVVATVTLTAAAGPGGMAVVLTSSDPALAAVPSGIVVPQGTAQATFMVRSSPVTAIDSVDIAAAGGGTSESTTLTILPYPTIDMQEDSIVGGNIATLVATLVRPAPPGGVTLQLQSSAPAVAQPFSPGELVEGESVGLIGVATYGVAAPVDVVITAVNAPFPTATGVRVLPAKLDSFDAVADGGCILQESGVFTKKFIAGNPVLFSVGLDGHSPPGGAHVSISVDRPDILTLLDSADIPEFSGEVIVTAVSELSIPGPEVVILSATYGSVVLYDTITVVPTLRYAFHNLSLPGDGQNVPADLNEMSDALISTSAGCFIWRDGVRIPSPCGAALNDSGWVAGTVYQSGRGTVMLYKEADTVTIPHLDADYLHSVAVDMNNRGEIAMRSSSVGIPGPTKFLLWRDPGLIDAGTLDPYSLNVMTLNDSGQAAGWLDGSGTPSPTPLPFFWNGSSPSIIDIAPDRLGTAWGMNNHGDVVGGFRQTTGTYAPSWFLAGGGTTDYFEPLIGWNRATAFDINDSGAVVGAVGTGDGYLNAAAFLHIGGTTYDLNCIADVPPGFRLSRAIRINNAGDILGYDESGGLFRSFVLTRGPITAVHDDGPRRGTGIPALFALHQNYPNPFNPATTIRYDLPKASHVTLRVFNVLGREVATLVDGRREAGSHEVRFEGSELPSGVYFYRLSDGTATRTRKLVMLR